MIVCAYVSSEGGHRPVAFKEELQVSIGSEGVGGGVKSMYHCHQHWQERETNNLLPLSSALTVVSALLYISLRGIYYLNFNVCVCVCVCVCVREREREASTPCVDDGRLWRLWLLRSFGGVSTSLKISCRTKRDVGYRGQSYLFYLVVVRLTTWFQSGKMRLFFCFFFFFFLLLFQGSLSSILLRSLIFLVTVFELRGACF